MAGARLKVRTRLIVWWRRIWRYRLTAAGFTLALLGAITAVNEPPKVLGVTVGAVGLFVAGLEIRANRRRAAALRIQVRANDDYRDLDARAGARERIVRTPAGTGVVLRDETDHLLRGDVAVELAGADFELHRELKEYSLELLSERARRGAMHNDAVLGLGSDLPVAATAEPVILRRAMYFDFVCSNVLAQNDIEDVKRRVTLLNGRRLFINRVGELRPFAESRLANVIGVSTLAFTTDGKLVLVQQTNNTVGSPGLIAPSGSGALEPQDFPADDFAPTSLRDVLLRGTERELQEECNLAATEIIVSCLVGHARWISRGAMPEFCSVTLLDVPSHELQNRTVRRQESPFVQVVSTERLASAESWDPDSPLDMLPEERRPGVSWPLAFGLSCLAERIHDESWPMRKDLLRVLATS